MIIVNRTHLLILFSNRILIYIYMFKMKHKKSELSKKKSMRIEHAKMAREYEMQKQLLQEQVFLRIMT